MLRLEKRNKLEKQLGLLIRSFLKLGFTAFGGPAAAYAMMRQEFVLVRKWLSEDEFFEFMGIANLIPGPNAVELALMIGHAQAGWLGLALAGICFIFPAMAIVLAFAWIYESFGTLPQLAGILYGIKPVIIGLLLSAIWEMLKPRLKNMPGLLIVVVVFSSYLLGVSPVFLLLGGGLCFFIWQVIRKGSGKGALLVPILPISWHGRIWFQEGTGFSLLRLFWVFIKAGALMYGSGYVLLAFIYEDLVVRLGWLTNNQLVDAIAVGQFTPGPFATTATFVGFLLGGIPGAFLATAAMFLPSFLITCILILVMKKLIISSWTKTILEGVSFAALGLMAAVTWGIIGTSIVDLFTALLALIALVLIVWRKIQAPWLVLGGAVIGLIRTLIG